MYHVNHKHMLYYYTSKKYRVSDMNPSVRVGTFRVDAKGTRYSDKEENIEDGYTETYVIDVTPDEDHHDILNEDIIRAIRDTFSKNDCHHEYDCCGCRSWYCYDVIHIRNNEFMVTVGSSRNY